MNRLSKGCGCCSERASYDEFETEEQANHKMIDTDEDEYGCK
ncbi:MAG: hypothetical protein WC292_04210 [Clostridia bacterium]